MRKIRNAEALLSHGDAASRRIVLDITEKTLQALDAGVRIRSIMSLDGSMLRIGTKMWDLDRYDNVYMLGAGKACNHMAMAVDDILGDRLTKGIVIVKIAEETDHYQHTDAYVGGHPLPNQAGYEACQKILALVDQAGPRDLFLAVISGGSSALMSCPREGITLDDEIRTTDVMLKSGAGIYEVNAVRRHISAMNGGMLAARIQSRGAELIGIGISDAVGNPPTADIGIPRTDYASTPIGPDRTTLDDARRVIREYNVRDRLPENVVRFLDEAGPEQETPKAFPRNTYYVLNTVPDSCRIAQKICAEMGLRSIILTSFLEGESRDAGTFFASIAREAQTFGNPLDPPFVVLSSGETTTKITDNREIRGHGGPGQELTLSFAITAAKTQGACMLSIDSEGTDGTTPVAGGICDSTSLACAERNGVDVYDALRGHACYEALEAMGDTVFTGNTGTNLCDFNVMYVPEVEK